MVFLCRAGKRQRGPFSHVREWPPLDPPRERKGPCPLTPHIGSLQLEELHALRNRVQCTWLRHESLRFVTVFNRALLPCGASDDCLAADCVRNSGIASLAALMGAAVDGN